MVHKIDLVIFLSIIFVVLLVSGCTQKPCSGAECGAIDANKLTGGIVLGVESTNISRDSVLIQKAGVASVRVPIRWEEIEPAAGVFIFEKLDATIATAREKKVSVLLNVRSVSSWATLHPPTTGGPYLASSLPKDLNLWNEFLRVLVARYANSGVEVSYEIQNEVNAPSFWDGTIEDYVVLLKQSYATIKATDANTIVLASSLACGITKDVPLSKTTLAINSFRSDINKILASRAFDALAVHDYYFPERVVNGVTFDSYLDIVQQVMLEQNMQVPLWITEYGFVSQNATIGARNDVGSLTQQAAWVRGVLLEAEGKNVSRMYYLLLSDRDEAYFGSMGLFTSGGELRPAGMVLLEYTKIQASQ